MLCSFPRARRVDPKNRCEKHDAPRTRVQRVMEVVQRGVSKAVVAREQEDGSRFWKDAYGFEGYVDRGSGFLSGSVGGRRVT